MSQALPFPNPLVALDATHVLWQGRTLLYFAGCDYFRLSHHPEVRAQAAQAVHELGINVAASRLTTGNQWVYGELETALADFFGVPRVLSVSSGYVSNLVVAQALSGQFDTVLVDERAHGSLLDAIDLLKAPALRFRHRDPEDVARHLHTLDSSQRVILMTDGMFPLDGVLAPLKAYQELLSSNGWLWVDDAHGAGTLGQRGGGAVEWSGVVRRNLIQTGTLSKAFGVYGGWVIAPEAVLDGIRDRSRLFAGNTPLSPALARAACTAIQLLARHTEWRVALDIAGKAMHREIPYRHPSQWGSGTEGRSMNPDDRCEGAEPNAQTCNNGKSGGEVVRGPVATWIPIDEAAGVRMRDALLEAGIYPPWIRYPGGPCGGAFRFAWSSAHTEEEIQTLRRAIQ